MSRFKLALIKHQLPPPITHSVLPFKTVLQMISLNLCWFNIPSLLTQTRLLTHQQYIMSEGLREFN